MSIWNPISTFVNYFCGSKNNEELKTEANNSSYENPENLLRRLDLKISRLDPTKKIDENNWAVTMVRQRKNLHPYIPIQTPHVLLIIESIENDLRFTKAAHLMSKQEDDFDISNIGIVQTFCIEEHEPIRFKTRTKTWVVSGKKVKQMWDQIQLEERQTESFNNTPKEQITENPVPFCLVGQSSVFAKNVAIFRTNHPSLQEMQEQNPAKFQNLCHLLEEEKEPPRFGLSESQGLKNQVISLVSNKVIDVADQFTGGAVRAILTPIAAAAIVYVAYCGIKDSLNYISIKYHKNALEELKKNSSGIKKEILKANNCFTWSRDKLKMVDIVLEETVWDRLVAVPMPHLKKE